MTDGPLQGSCKSKKGPNKELELIEAGAGKEEAIGVSDNRADGGICLAVLFPSHL